jgi:hypothetical protein
VGETGRFPHEAVGGLGAGKWTFAVSDPLTGRKVALKVLSLKAGRAVLQVPLTDSVRLLAISR